VSVRRAYLGLGSNLDDRFALLQGAVDARAVAVRQPGAAGSAAAHVTAVAEHAPTDVVGQACAVVLAPGKRPAADRQHRRAGQEQQATPGCATALMTLSLCCQQPLLTVLVVLAIDVTRDVLSDHGFDI
jgi:hypothetical protein